MPFELPTRAYDLQMQDRAVDRTRDDGWVFGLPPGIATAQWPRDPVSGYPLMHGFTLKLPPDYRVHGDDIVAVSFFATAPDHNDGGASEDPAIRAAVMAIPPHPRAAGMTDLLGYAYAAILLTQAEYDGPYAAPPAPLPIATAPRPRWLDLGGAGAFCESAPGLARRLFAQPPRAGLDATRAIRLAVRATDPNAGKAPRDTYSTSAPTGYQPFYFYAGGVVSTETFRVHDWAKDHGHNHLGGTMRPSQGIPEISPFYIEFEEEFGGYNFGGGNAQFDFKQMMFDWACG